MLVSILGMARSGINKVLTSLRRIPVIRLATLSTSDLAIAIGAPYNDDGGDNSGHVRVYDWSGSVWTQRGSDIDGDTTNENSGSAVSMSSDGDVVAIGAHRYNAQKGKVRIYDWSGSAWTQRGSDLIGDASQSDFGFSLSLDSSGDVVVIGAHNHNNNDDTTNIGNVRIYAWSGSAWVQRGSDIIGEDMDDTSGRAVSISSDGTIVAIGANYNDDGGSNSGHVRVYSWSGSSWDQQGFDIDGEATHDQSGIAVSLSSDGTMVAIGGHRNNGGGTQKGHVRVYTFA